MKIHVHTTGYAVSDPVNLTYGSPLKYKNGGDSRELTLIEWSDISAESTLNIHISGENLQASLLGLHYLDPQTEQAGGGSDNGTWKIAVTWEYVAKEKKLKISITTAPVNGNKYQTADLSMLIFPAPVPLRVRIKYM
jgi:hypothetical protein